MDKNFWLGKRVFLTGHTGFKGGWLSIVLHQLGAHVTGYSLKDHTSGSMYEIASISGCVQDEFFGDICDAVSLRNAMKSSKPEIIIHMAAQPLVGESYANPVRNFDVNLMGLINILQYARECGELRSMIIVTSDKCYLNSESKLPFNEDSALGGSDPYSASKACAEIITNSYRSSFYDINSVGIATVRAGNVIGGGDFCKSRLIPDFFGAANDGSVLHVRNKHATRPWQHVLEPLRGYLKLAEMLWKAPETYSKGWNFGPNSAETLSVLDVIEILSASYGRVEVKYLEKTFNEASNLSIDSGLAQRLLGWEPKWSAREALAKTTDWMIAYKAGIDMHKFSISQFQESGCDDRD